MRIAIIGVPGLGVEKVRDMFHKNWNVYEYVKFPELDESKEDIESQESAEEEVIKFAEKNLQKIKEYTKFEDKVLFETIPLEWLLVAIRENEAGDFSDNGVRKLFEISNEALKYLDCVYIVPKSKYNAIEDTSVDQYIIDDMGQLYDMIIHSFNYGEPCPFFNLNDCPGFIEIFGSDEQKIEMFKLYLNEEGNLIDDNLQQLFSPEQIAEGQRILEAELKNQKEAQKKEAFYKQLKQYKH